MASKTGVQANSKVSVIIVTLFILCISCSIGSYAQESGIDKVNEELLGANCTISNEKYQCKNLETGLGCYNKKCTCLKDAKSPVFGGNINVISEWNITLERCVALAGSLCDLEGRVLLCKGQLECRKADGDFGKLPSTFGVGKCEATAFGASAILVTFLVWVTSKGFFMNLIV